jgi:U3 small nucleolar RNA-associated protein 22
VNGKPVLSKGYSCLQMFKATLQFLAARDLVTNPLLIGAVKVEAGDDRGPVLFDGQRGINFLFKMTDWSYKMVYYKCINRFQLE